MPKNNNTTPKIFKFHTAKQIIDKASLDFFFSMHNPNTPVPLNLPSLDESETRKISHAKYNNSQLLARIFTGYFHLFEYHHGCYEECPELFERFLVVILSVFSSVEKKRMERIIQEISVDRRMEEFYRELYQIWEEEWVSIEKFYC